MSIKASKNSLSKLLADNGGDDLIAHDKTKKILPKLALPSDAFNPVQEAGIVSEETEPTQDPPSVLKLPIASEITPLSEEIELPALPVTAAKPYRSQGLTIYESDDDLVDGFIDYLRKKKLRIGRKKGFSLFARAGLRALEDLRMRNPIEFEDLLTRALLEQK